MFVLAELAKHDDRQLVIIEGSYWVRGPSVEWSRSEVSTHRRRFEGHT